MKILFCNIASMRYYQGNTNTDPPSFGGSYVEKTGDAYEKYNFLPFKKNGLTICCGFFEPKKSGSDKRNQVHLEKIVGCEGDINSDVVDDILVVFCSKYDNNRYVIVGWYKNASVYRWVKEETDISVHGDSLSHEYNVVAHTENCVLLPYSTRNHHIWAAKRRKKGVTYGFGQANHWYASENTDNAIAYKKRIIEQIMTYTGQNDMH